MYWVKLSIKYYILLLFKIIFRYKRKLTNNQWYLFIFISKGLYGIRDEQIDRIIDGKYSKNAAISNRLGNTIDKKAQPNLVF